MHFNHLANHINELLKYPYLWLLVRSHYLVQLRPLTPVILLENLNENSPFPGISASPCQVFVAVEHEQFARQLVEEHEARHRERLARDEKSEA